jgi:hypothetical protein
LASFRSVPFAPLETVGNGGSREMITTRAPTAPLRNPKAMAIPSASIPAERMATANTLTRFSKNAMVKKREE